MFGPLNIPLPPQTQSQQILKSYENGLTVRADREVYDSEKAEVELIGNVVATFGPTTLKADRLRLAGPPTDPYGEAIGNVSIVDPEGTIEAASAEFHWKTNVGSAKNVLVRVGNLKLEAEAVQVTPGLWTLSNVGGTGCKLKTPLYYIHTRELQIRPGKGIRASRPQLSIFGRKLVTLPDQRFSFNEGGGSIDVPYPTYRSERGFGLNWSPSFSIGTETEIFGHYAVFQRSLPFYNAVVLHSFIRGRSPDNVRTEIGDRLGFGYFDSVQVRSPDDEAAYLRAPRFDFGASTTFGADARDTTTATDKINKPIELLGQVSGNVGGFGVFGLARWQQIGVGNGPKTSRLILEQNIGTPMFELGSRLSAFGRLDAAEFLGDSDYRWIRGQAGLQFEANRNIRFGAAYASAKAYGTPDFAYDAPFRFRELNLRADLDYDTTQLRVLLKFDPSNRQLFDREIYFSQVIGCIEPFIVYRERPRKFFIGIKLPIGRDFQKLSNAVEERSKAVQHVISGG